MTADTLPKAITLSACALGALLSGLAARLQWLPTFTTHLWVLSAIFALVGVIRPIRDFFNRAPYLSPVLTEWQSSPPEIRAYPDVFIIIPASLHNKGKDPDIEFIVGDTIQSDPQLLASKNPNGDVLIKFKENDRGILKHPYQVRIYKRS